MRMRGKVVRVFLPRGFAFVQGDDGQDYFLQANEFKGVWDGQNVAEGKSIDFEPAKLPRGLRALDARMADA